MSQQPVALLTRKETFSACHRLHSKHLSDEENAEIYGKCNNPNGHGHNYTADIKLAMDAVIFKQLDHKNLDKDVDYFKNLPSTTENLTIFIWDNIRDKLKYAELLYEVKVYETDKNSVTYRGPYPYNNSQYLQNKRSAKTSCTNISSDSD
uniref:6-pyruvoyl tetrahydrobiopterin synthase n=1 Tax=Glossina morsitans morsitans TaxID=37546 RepID=A0A1B0G503_GLOMM